MILQNADHWYIKVVYLKLFDEARVPSHKAMSVGVIPKLRLGLVFVCLLFCYISLAQTGEGGLVHYNVTDGLPSSEVHDVIEDNNHLIWIATDRGVCSFDGYSFRIYGPSDGMFEQTVWRILKDDYGKLWFIGLSGKLHYYENDQFHSYPHNSEIEALNYGDLRNLSYALDGDTLSIWVGHVSKMLKVSVSTMAFSTHAARRVKAGLHIQSGNNDGFIIQSPRNKRHRIFWGKDVFEFPDKDSIHLSQVGKPLFLGDECLIAGNRALLSMNKKQKTITKVSDAFNVFSLEKHESEHVHVCMDNVVVRYINATIDTFQTFEKNIQIGGCYEDHEGGHWFSSLSDGLFYRPGAKITPVKRHIVSGPVVNTIVTDEGYYAGVSKVGYFKIGESRGTDYAKRADMTDYFENLLDSYNVVEDKFGTFKWNQYAQVPLFQSNSRRLWIVNSMETFLVDSDGALISLEEIRGSRTYAIEYFQGAWYIGTTKGLFRYEEGRLNYLAEDNDKFACRVSHILTTDSLMYITTIGEGLLVYNAQKLESYNSVNSSLPSNYCSHVHADSYGHLWISTNDGLAKCKKDELDAGNGNFIAYGIEDGLSSNEVLITQARGDYLYIGNKAGLDKMNIWADRVNESADYHLGIDYMSIDGQEVNLDGKMTLLADQNDIEIGFKGICYRCLGELEYSYRIKGLTDEWQTTTQTNIQQFNVRYGDYTLELKCKGYKLEESDVVTLNFSIQRPFYFQTWFILLLLIVLSAIGFAIARTIIIRKKLTRKLQQYQYTTFTAQLNPHFIFNTLNAIQNLFLKREVKDGVNYMSSFGNLLRGILQNPSHELTSLKEELGLLSNYINLERIRMRATLGYENPCSLTSNPENIQVPPMLLQPLVENSINHGILPKKGGDVTVSVTELSDRLRIEVRDNGVGINHSQPNRSRERPSYGLKLVKERVNLINRMKGLKCNFEIIDLEDRGAEGTLIKFCLPLIIEKTQND